MNVETPTSQPYQGYSNSATWAFSLAINNERAEYSRTLTALEDCKTREHNFAKERFLGGFLETHPQRLAKTAAKAQAAWCEGEVNVLEVATEFWTSYEEGTQ